jgi:hypothetical protein
MDYLLQQQKRISLNEFKNMKVIKEIEIDRYYLNLKKVICKVYKDENDNVYFLDKYVPRYFESNVDFRTQDFVYTDLEFERVAGMKLIDTSIIPSNFPVYSETRVYLDENTNYIYLIDKNSEKYYILNDRGLFDKNKSGKLVE